MTQPLLERFLSRLRTEYPSYPLVVLPYSREDPTIEYFIHLLDVPIEELSRVLHHAWELAFEVFGEETIPFHLTPMDPEISAESFPEALEEHRRGPGRVPA